MLLLLAFLLILLPADPSLPFHAFVQIAVALAACRVFLARSVQTSRSLPSGAEKQKAKSAFEKTGIVPADKAETESLNKTSGVGSGEESGPAAQKRMEMVGWLILAMAVAPLLVSFAWIDTPSSVAAWRKLAALALFAFTALWLGGRWRLWFLGALAPACLLAFLVARIPSLANAGSFLQPLFQSPDSASAFPAVSSVFFIVFPILLIGGLARGLEEWPEPKYVLLGFGSLLLLGLVFVMAEGSGELRLLWLSGLAAVSSIVFLRTNGRIRLRIVLLTIFMGILAYSASAAGIAVGRSFWPLSFLPSRELNPVLLPIKAAPWGIGPGAYETALHAVRPGVDTLTSWFGGWLRGLAELGFWGLLFPVAFVMILISLRPHMREARHHARLGVAILTVLVLMDFLLGWSFFALSVLGWVTLAWVCALALPGERRVAPLRQRIAFGVLALLLVITAGLTEVSNYLVSVPVQDGTGLAPAGRNLLAARLAPWESHPDMAVWRSMSRNSAPNSVLYQDGLRSLKRAARLSPRNPDVLLSLAKVYLADGSFDRYVATLEKAVAYNARNVAVHRALAEARENLGEYEEAIRLQEVCANLEPDEVTHRLAIARILEKMDRPEEALREYRKALSLDFSNAEARRSYAELIQRLHLGPTGSATDESNEVVPEDSNGL